VDHLPRERLGGLEWSNASYVKIRDEFYFAYWLEEACNGTLGTILINLHDARQRDRLSRRAEACARARSACALTRADSTC
jgi:hypothetical protein